MFSIVRCMGSIERGVGEEGGEGVEERGVGERGVEERGVGSGEEKG